MRCLLFYTWLPDNNGLKVAVALMRAAARGVVCRARADGLGSRLLIGTAHWRAMESAGVRIFEYQGGLLHTKSLTPDGEIAPIGSANLDRRSFDLNYENNILFHDAALTGRMRERQARYLAGACAVTLDEVQGWSRRRRLWNNAIAVLGPVL